jgi:hypothetical protein
MNVIHSIGPPPDRYANRVVGTMLRELAKQRAKNTDAIMKLFHTSNDGNPAAQQRLVKRIEAAGAMHVGLTPGKRGKYQIVFYDMTGWDIGRDKEVLSFDPAPDDANICLVVNANMLTSLGNGRNIKDIKGRRVLLISKHILTRLVQRFDARTPVDLLKGARNIMEATLDHAVRFGVDEFFEHEHRVEMTQGATLVLRPDDKQQVMVAMTIFRKGEPQ